MEEKLKKRERSKLVKISELLPKVKESLGLESSMKIAALNELWPLVVGFNNSKQSKPIYFDRDNNLVIGVNSSPLMAELSMQKIAILKRLKEAVKNSDLQFTNIRFVNRNTT